jgi:secreted trypsin-like serine protease
MTIFAGSNTVSTGTQIRTVSKIIVHPSYNPNTLANDIPLFQLSTPLLLSDSSVKKICLPVVSTITLAAGEWPPIGISVSNSFLSVICFDMEYNTIE